MSEFPNCHEFHVLYVWCFLKTSDFISKKSLIVSARLLTGGGPAVPAAIRLIRHDFFEVSSYFPVLQFILRSCMLGHFGDPMQTRARGKKGERPERLGIGKRRARRRSPPRARVAP